MSTAKVSIVMPVYNTPELFLRQCLDSVVEQTLKELEIILVDDCSTDGSLGILEEYAKKDARILLIKQPQNRGISVARNTGAEQVTGEYLYFIDCDDWLEPTALEVLFSEAQEKEVDILFFEGETWYQTEELKKKFLPSRTYHFHYQNVENKVYTGQEWFEFTQETNQYCFMIWLQLVKSSYFKQNQLSFHPLTSCAGEDLPYSFRAILRASKVACCQNSFYHYRVREGSGSKSKKNPQFISGFTTTCLLILLCMKDVVSEKFYLYQQYFHELTQFCVKNYTEITEEDPTLLMETLENMKHLLFQEPLVTLEDWEDFSAVLKNHPELCFFGCGAEGKRCLEFFRRQGFPPPLAICDNNPKLWGTTLEGIPVISLENALETYKNCSFLITNTNFYVEIHKQLSENVMAKNILNLCY